MKNIDKIMTAVVCDSLFVQSIFNACDNNLLIGNKKEKSQEKTTAGMRIT